MTDEPIPLGCHPSDCCGDPSAHTPSDFTPPADIRDDPTYRPCRCGCNPAADPKETPMAADDNPRLRQANKDTWQLDSFTGGSSGRIRMERSAAGKEEVLLRFYRDQRGGTQDGFVWLKRDDLEPFVTALRALMQPSCTHCRGTGVQS